jgi:sugar O-acyltransferase (sialic acid O-acetyltransferase NeuD family)
MKKIVLVGYSSHALVAAEALMLSGYPLLGYLEKEKNRLNPLNLNYLGFEREESVLQDLLDYSFFPAIGDNRIRKEIILFLQSKGATWVNAIHPDSRVSKLASVDEASLVCLGACVNPFAKIGKGVILNTGCIVEHECIVGDYSHVAPGAVLTGNIVLGEGSFVGANAVIKQGVTIGKNVTIGAGTVILKDVEDNTVMVGNPGKIIRRT